MDTLIREVTRGRPVLQMGRPFPGLRRHADDSDITAKLASLRRDMEPYRRICGNDAAAGKGCGKKTNKSGKMFVQVPIGQRVYADGGDVLKFTVISFTLPDLVDKNFEIANAIKKESALLGSMAGNTISFARDDSLLGCFGASENAITGKQLHSMILGVYDAVERIVVSNKSSIPEDDFVEFMSKHNERKGKIGAVVKDALTIFSVPEHTGAIAYRNSEKFGQSFFRMEWLYKDFAMITMGPPSTGYRLGRFDESIAADAGDKEFIRTMMDFIKTAYLNGTSAIVGLQINNTATVGRCGALDTEGKALEEARRNELHENEQRRQYYMTAVTDENMIYSVTVSGQASSTGQNGGAQDSGGQGSDTNEVRRCKGCGSVIEQGRAKCSCRNSRHHRRA